MSAHVEVQRAGISRGVIAPIPRWRDTDWIGAVGRFQWDHMCPTLGAFTIWAAMSRSG